MPYQRKLTHHGVYWVYGENQLIMIIVISTNHGVYWENPLFVDYFSQPTQPMAMARKGPEADALEAQSDPNGMLRIWRPKHTEFS